MAIAELAELGQEYASIIFRQERGVDLWGDETDKFQNGDRERLSEIERIFEENGDNSLPQYIENSYQIYEDNTGQKI